MGVGPAQRYTVHGDCPGWFCEVDWAGDPSSEGRFTKPRIDCPHPDRWHSDDADSTEHEVSALVGAFVAALQPDNVVETGSAWGQTAECIGLALQAAGQGHLHTIEPDPVRAARTRERTKGMPVTVEEMESLSFRPPGPIGFAWFDSLPHLRIQEFHRYHQHFTPGAIVGFHDTGPHQGGLREAIEELEIANELLVIHLPTPRGVSFAQVLK